MVERRKRLRLHKNALRAEACNKRREASLAGGRKPVTRAERLPLRAGSLPWRREVSRRAGKPMGWPPAQQVYATPQCRLPWEEEPVGWVVRSSRWVQRGYPSGVCMADDGRGGGHSHCLVARSDLGVSILLKSFQPVYFDDRQQNSRLRPGCTIRACSRTHEGAIDCKTHVWAIRARASRSSAIYAPHVSKGEDGPLSPISVSSVVGSRDGRGWGSN